MMVCNFNHLWAINFKQSLIQLQTLMLVTAYASCLLYRNSIDSRALRANLIIKFCCSYQVVESMRQGMDPRDAATDAISRIARKYPNFIGAVFAVNKEGVHAGACHGWTFQYSVRNSSMQDVEVITVYP